MAVDCTGSGAQTIVLIGDIGQDGSQAWGRSAVPAGLSDRATVCSYDRLGLGTSDPASSTPSMANQTRVLEQVVATTGGGSPVVLVAQGFGTLIARSLAHEKPSAVAGMVLINPPVWGLDLQTPPDASSGVKAEYDSLTDINAHLSDYGAGSLPPPPVPVVVIGVDSSKPPLPESLTGSNAPFTPTTTTFLLPAADTQHAAQRELGNKSPFGRYVEVGSAGSYAQYWSPDAVVSAVQDVLTDPNLRR